MKWWDAAETNYLRLWYGKKHVKEIAEGLGRSVSSVKNRAQLIGLKAPEGQHIHHEKVHVDLRHMALLLAQRKTIKEAAEEMGVSATTAYRRMSRLPNLYQKMAKDNETRKRKRVMRETMDKRWGNEESRMET